MRSTHLYLATCVANGKVYVGKTVQEIARRWSRHVLDAKKGLDLFFYRAILKYGPESFRIEEISLVDSDRADDLERFWIEYFQSNDSEFGYNSTLGGEGFSHTDEQKRRISASCKKWWTPERRAAASASRKGRLCGEKNPMFGKAAFLGKTHSEETKRRLSKKRIELYQNPDFKRRMAEANIGKHHTAEGRRNISLAQIGRPNRRPNYRPPEETKHKTAETMRRFWKNKKALPDLLGPRIGCS